MLQPTGIVNTLLIKYGFIDTALPFFTNATWARVTVIIINCWVGIPYTLLQVTGILQNIPGELYEAAKIEGATAYESFWKITLPMVSPQIITVVVYTIVDSFLRSGINDVIDYQYTQAFYGKHAAMSWIYVLASVLILAIAVGILNKVVFYQDDKK